MKKVLGKNMLRQENRDRTLPYSCLHILLPTSFASWLALLLVAGAAAQDDASVSPTQLKFAARKSFQQGDTEQGHEHLTAILDLYRTQRGSDPYAWCSRLAEVAREYLRAGELRQASLILGEAADLNLPFNDAKDSGLGSAAAGWHRRLATLDAEDRFELLRDWTMPTESRMSVRVLTALTPIDAPPAIFARALGERSRRDSFAVPEVGGVRGLFNSAWQLVLAADESGGLRRLTGELSRLAADDVPNADFVLTLAKIVGSRRVDDSLLAELTEHASTLKQQAGGSRFATLPLEQRVWRFGYGRFDAETDRTIDFTGFPYWDGGTWRGGIVHPDNEIGWTAVRAEGGHPGRVINAIRRWVAPADGTLSVTGNLGRAGTKGNGVLARLISSRSGTVDQWFVRTGSVETGVDGVAVERGDTIDFMVDPIDSQAELDSFTWTVQLDLTKKDGGRKTFDSVSGFHGPARSIADVVVAATCLSKDRLQPIGESILQTKLKQTFDHESLRMRPFLRYAHATALQMRFDDASTLLNDSRPALWLPSRAARAWPNPRGNVRATWLSDEQHILHAFGPRNDYLLFKYPLTGEFEFSCKTQIGGPGGTDGCVAYAGLGYELWAARDTAKIWDAGLRKVAEFDCPFVADTPIATFNHFSVKSTESGITISANKHPIWTDTPTDNTSPWIGLRSWGERTPVFRDLKIVGDPVIPREVKLSGGDSLRGWSADYYGERMPLPANPEHGQATNDWFSEDGVIHGVQIESETTRQSRLCYLRPLLDGESISYEFQYQPDEFEVHPTLGRIAFLIEPGGVRLHWLTDGDDEWTGLAEDNSVVEPLNRRGPKPLPLIAGEWNRVAMTLRRGTLTLSMNDETIYTRRMEPSLDRTFGFYHDKSRSAARVRKVVLRGDWPERLTNEQRGNLAATANPDRTTTDRQLLAAIFDDRHVHGSVFAVRRQAAKLPPAERYAFLADWVLPGRDHHTPRMALDFTPTNPAPPVANRFAVPSDERRAASGGELVSPALDLVAAAKELGKLDALRERVAAISVVDDAQQQRSQLAMLALIDMADGELVAAKQRLDKLALMTRRKDSFSFRQRWPETLAISEAVRYSETRDAARDMAYQILVNQVRERKSSGVEAWDQHMTAVASRVAYFDLLERAPTPRDITTRSVSEEKNKSSASLANASGDDRHGQLLNWVPTARETARTRGQGFPPTHWATSAPATVTNFTSHHDDYLFYRIPLRGDFEIECDVTGFGYQETNLWVAGRWVAPVYTFKHVDVGDIRESQRLALDPPIHKPNAWIRYRAVVRDGVCATYANGRKIHERVLPAEHDPWIAVRSYYKTNGAVRNLRIIGQPEVPREVRLAVEADLPGWLPINHDDRVGPSLEWRHLDDGAKGNGIQGARQRSLPGSHWEALLRYHRPMVEDGTIEYEFFYRQGSTHVHPAVDRLAFMLQPDGVRVHWVTDGKYDRTELAPDNLFDEPDNRLGPEALPLRQNAWNRLRLSLDDDTITLQLNDESIYRRKLEVTNQRTFGLFYYADRTEALVRNIVWRGDWPRELPAVAEQELAGEGWDLLDESMQELPAVFRHDFTTDGLPPKRFGLNVGSMTHLNERPDGLHVARPGGEGYKDTAIAPRLTVRGDFDIIAAFDQFEGYPSRGGSSGAILQATLDNEDATECLIYRRHLRHRAVPEPVVQAQYVTREVGGARRSHFPTQVVEATAGRLRLARRGETVYFLFAENDSPHFRLFGKSQASTDDIRQLRLWTQTHLEGMTKVVWKNLTIRAERLSGLAVRDLNELLADLNKQRDALPQRFAHDFAEDSLSEDKFQAWGPFGTRTQDGVPLTSIGTDRWTSSGFNSLLGIAGDFDTSITFEDLELARPTAKRNSSLYLQVEFPDARRTQVNVLAVKHIDDQLQVFAQIKTVDAGGNSIYRRVQIDDVNSVEKLRLVRRGKNFSFLYRGKGAERDTVLAQREINDMAVPQAGLRVMFHTGGDGRQSEVLLKQFDVRAEQLTRTPAKNSEPTGLLQSIFKLFE